MIRPNTTKIARNVSFLSGSDCLPAKISLQWNNNQGEDIWIGKLVRRFQDAAKIDLTAVPFLNIHVHLMDADSY